MLKNIVIEESHQDAPGRIVVDSKALLEEVEARTHRRGAKTYVERLIMGRTRLQKNPNWWPDEKKIEVAALFASGVVNATELERLTSVPSTAIRTWRGQDWWPELLERIHASIDQDTVSKLTGIVDKALDVVQDRLINGEYHIKNQIINKKTGETRQIVSRKPVSMKDATSVATTVVDKRQLLRGKATSRAEKVTVDARLEQLAAEFKRFVSAKDVTPELPMLPVNTL